MTQLADELGTWVVSRFRGAKPERDNFDTLWQELARLVIPREATFRQEISPGIERTRSILDSTAPRALELFASFLATTANNPSTKWFDVNVADKELAKDTEVKKYLEEVRDIMLEEMAAAKLYSHLHQVYLDLGSWGTGPIIIERDTDVDAPSAVQYMATHMQGVYVLENERGEIDHVFRQLKWTALQIKGKFPDAPLPERVTRILNDPKANDPNEKFKLIHATVPVVEGVKIPGLPENASRGPWVHVWVFEDDGATLDVSESDRMKYAIPRWYTARGEAYGRSPAMTVLPEIRMANRMRDTILRAAEKLTDPPMILPDGGLVTPLRLFAGGLSFSEGDVKPEPLLPPGASRPDVGIELLEDTRMAIREGFFVPLFATPESPVKTATQVLQETDERNRAVSPMIVRIHEELLEPVVIQTFMILREAGRLPAPPLRLQERPSQLTVRFTSAIFAAQRAQEALGAVRLLEGLAPWAEATQNPAIFDRYDVDAVSDVIHNGSGAPMTILRTDTDVRRIRRDRAQQQEQQNAIAQAAQLADAAQGFREPTG